MKRIFAALTLAAALSACCSGGTKDRTEYTPDWRSLAQHTTPQWLLDAKFGLYSHWGPQSVMIQDGLSDQAEGSIIDAFPRWTADKFDAKEWARIYKDAGAQFGGVVAIHGSGCVNWDSEVTSWNSTNHGPKIDILGELSEALRAEDIRVVATFHNVRQKGIWGERSLEDRTFIEPNFSDETMRTDQRWMQGWYERIIEAATKYKLDIAWFDTSFGDTVGGELNGYVDAGHFSPEGGTERFKRSGRRANVGGISEEYQKQFIADYYNSAEADGREVEVMFKTNDIPVNIGMRDIENGSLNGVQYDPWVSDVNMQHHDASYDWFYNPRNGLKDANCLVDMLIDMTSKNGRLLLNVPAQIDGTFPETVLKEIRQIGAWLRVNGEGIYGTTPWSIMGEGKTRITNPGHHGQGKYKGTQMAQFTAEDLRYTTKGDAVYAFVLATPESDRVRFCALGSGNKLYPGEVKKVELLGSNAKIKWSHEESYLEVTIPEGMPESFAYCFKVICGKQ